MTTSSRLLAIAVGLLGLLPFARFREEDPVTQDPGARDADHPATMIEAPPGLTSEGKRLNGILYLAAGEGPHPTVLLLHGLPGNERNGDLAQTLRRAGWNVAFFHYRGAWGSEGDFSFVNCVEDALAMLAFLRAEETQELYRVDPENIVLVGHSLGGWVALVAGARDAQVRGVVSMAAADLGLWKDFPAEGIQGFGEQLEASMPLHVPDGAVLFTELEESEIDVSLPAQSNGLSKKALLFVSGSQDVVVPAEPNQGPLLAALREAEASDVTEVTLEADHSFSSKRIALARTIVDWLDERF